jgi:diguanylate cyclase (GGDEF)-like protein
MATFHDKVLRLRKSFEEFSQHMSPEALQHFGGLSPEQRDFFTKQIYHDTLVPGVGNKRAYEDFRSRPREGVHVTLDLNDFKALNDTFSYQHGDDAISAAGKAFSEASRANKGKLFRVGGDEFRAHFETPEQAYSFLRHASQGVSNMVPVGGTHKVSFSAGIGHNPDHADQALHHAKAAKVARYGSFREGTATLGHGQHFAHSLLTGAAGSVPTHEESPIPGALRNKPTTPMPMPNAAQPL